MVPDSEVGQGLMLLNIVEAQQVEVIVDPGGSAKREN